MKSEEKKRIVSPKTSSTMKAGSTETQCPQIAPVVGRSSWSFCPWQPLSRVDKAAAKTGRRHEVEPMDAMEIRQTGVPSHRHASWIHAVLRET